AFLSFRALQSRTCLTFHLRSEISGISGIARWVARVSGAISGRVFSWDARYLKFHCSFSFRMTVRTDRLWRNTMQEVGYRRFKIEPKQAPHVYQIPEGFDGMWTDMSEIVRPTRDGVYGREYISTSVDIGPKPTSIDFAKINYQPKSLEIPVPIIFDELPTGTDTADIRAAVGLAAERIGTLNISRDIRRREKGLDNLLPIIDEEGIVDNEERDQPEIAEFDAETLGLLGRLLACFDRASLIDKLHLREESGSAASRLVRQGVHGLHLYADYHGQDYSRDARHISTALKDVHQQLVREGLRDKVTIIASGGITLAEHVPKAIICGADLVAIDTTVLVALQAEFKGETSDRANHHLVPRRINPEWGAQRLVNLIGVWHDPLIE